MGAARCFQLTKSHSLGWEGMGEGTSDPASQVHTEPDLWQTHLHMAELPFPNGQSAITESHLILNHSASRKVQSLPVVFFVQTSR